MSPRTRQWRPRHRSAANEPGSNPPPVLEDYESFEVETAELSIEDVDDHASSVLLSNDSFGLPGNNHSDETHTVVTRNSLTLVNSPHNLATTSVVLATQHAHAMEFRSLAVSSTARLNDASCKPFTPVTYCIEPVDRGNVLFSTDLTSVFPVHLLTVNSSADLFPENWSQYLLAFTDAPAFVRAVTSDLQVYAFHRFQTHTVEPLLVDSCDSTCKWTTCQTTCCEADVEIISQASTSDLDSAQSLFSNNSAPNIPNQRITLLAYPDHLSLRAPVGFSLLSFPGVRPEYFERVTVATAIYVLLVADHDRCSPSSDPEYLPSSDDVVVRLIDEEPHVENPSSACVLAMLVALVPATTDSRNTLNPINVSHQLDRSRISHLLKSGQNSNLVPLIALVDIIEVNDPSNGKTTMTAIIHQRVHYLPELAFILQSAE